MSMEVWVKDVNVNVNVNESRIIIGIDCHSIYNNIEKHRKIIKHVSVVVGAIFMVNLWKIWPKAQYNYSGPL